MKISSFKLILLGSMMISLVSCSEDYEQKLFKVFKSEDAKMTEEQARCMAKKLVEAKLPTKFYDSWINSEKMSPGASSEEEKDEMLAAFFGASVACGTIKM